jgi:molecular chaperone DnaK
MAENVVYQTEKLFKEHGDKLDASKKGKADAALEDLKKAVKSGDTDQMKAKMEALNREMQALSSELYAHARPSGAQGQQADGGAQESKEKGNRRNQEGGGKPGDGDVIDADFEVKDDKK